MIRNIFIALFIILVSTSFSAKEVFAQLANTNYVEGFVSDVNNVRVAGADVSVSCNGVTYTGVTESSNLGRYQISFTPEECPEGATATTNASKGLATGSNTGVMTNQSSIPGLYLVNAQIDVQILEPTPSVPEFGLLSGVFTFIISSGSFLLLKRKK